MFDFGPKRPVAALCVFSGRWTVTQATLTRRQFDKLSHGLHYWCPSCRKDHNASGAQLAWMASDGVMEPGVIAASAGAPPPSAHATL
jgi:hypothetical protein